MHPGAINCTEPGLGEGTCPRAARPRWNHRTESLASWTGCCCCGWHQSVWDGGNQCRGRCGPSQKQELLTALLPPSIQAARLPVAPRFLWLSIPAAALSPLTPRKGSRAPSSPPLERARLRFMGARGALSVGTAWQKCRRWLREGGVNEMQAPRQAAEISLFPWV